MPPRDAYLIDGLRLPVGKAGGLYKTIIPERFTSYLLHAFREKYPVLETDMDELLLGNAVGTGGNMARYALLHAGFPPRIPASKAPAWPPDVSTISATSASGGTSNFTNAPSSPPLNSTATICSKPPKTPPTPPTSPKMNSWPGPWKATAGPWWR